MSDWSRLHHGFLRDRFGHVLLIGLAVPATLIIAFLIYRVSFRPAVQKQHMPSKLDDVEDIELYTIGGFHPVHLGDVYQNCYKIVHKLGWGGFSTVWLAREVLLSHYVALKIILAVESSDCSELEVFQLLESITNENPEGEEGRRYIGSLLDHFTIHGPNGHHLCLVSELMGPSVSALSDCPGITGDRRRMQPAFTRNIGRQVVLALKFMHSKQLCHGGAFKYRSQRREFANMSRSHIFEYTVQTSINQSFVGRRDLLAIWESKDGASLYSLSSLVVISL